ncbi:hypothetical protein JCM8097_006244 [Rhodosporidiobolus ruineniae]
MANPRQRRKMRSSTGKLKTSKQTIKNRNKVIVKGPKELADAWDSKKTVRQNYAALGLLSTSNPRQTGGLEPVAHTPYAVASATPATVEDLEAALEAQIGDSSDEDEEPRASTSAAAPKKEEKLRPGMARIIRDEKGNVVSIVMGGDNGEEKEEKLKAPQRGGEDSEGEEDEEESDDEEEKAQEEVNTPWGAPMRDWSVTKAEEAPLAFEEDEEMDEAEVDPKKTKQGIPLGGGVKKVAAKSDVIRNLEQRAQFKHKVVRHTSQLELEWLVKLVAKYDDDIQKMARDRKANPLQRTPGELKRMINKAGGFEALRAAAVESA